MNRTGGALTRLSHRRPALSASAAGKLGRIALARLSLLAVFAMLAGCVVGDPPELGQPQQTPPYLDTAKTDPTPGRVIQLDSGDTLPITVPYRSEDAGEDLFATLWLDFEVEGERPITFRQIPAGTLDDAREFSTSWTVPSPLFGCHQLTFVLTHVSSMDGAKPATDATDVATVTWWLNVGDSAEEPNLLADCPGPSGSEPTGTLSTGGGSR